jgi:LysM repeat protein
MSRRQVLLIIILNAIISLAISIGVVWVALGQYDASRPPLVPLSMPTGRPQPTPPKTDLLYVVQPGDSLSSIALRFGVPLGDLMRANNIQDADRISVGQRLIIPAGPVPERTPTPRPTTLPFEPPTPIVTAAATPIGGATRAVSTPALAESPLRLELTAAGDLPGEAIALINTGNASAALDGWSLSDQAGHQYALPALTLGAGQKVTLHTTAGKDTTNDLYWGLNSALWTKGATVILKDRNGEVVLKLSVE